MDKLKIGKLIRELRIRKGLTQEEFGKIFDVDFREVSKWELGYQLPDVSIISNVSKTLGITTDELLSGMILKSRDNIKKYNYKDNNKYMYISILICIILVIFIVCII